MMEKEFCEIFDNCIEREGADKLMEWLAKSDFFTAPASTRFHGSHPGGLVEHSVNVYNRLKKLVDACWPETYKPSDETIAIVSLLHDLCKVNFYTEVKKSRKTGRLLPNGKPEWEDYIGYDIDDRLCMGHGEGSVYIISAFMRLTREEAIAIRWHMGGFDEAVKGGSYALNGAWDKYPLAVLLHCADLQATHFDENE